MTGQTGQSSQPTVLIADDEHHIRCVLGEKLRKAGIHVIEASDGEEALTLTLRHVPSLIISDLQMPRKSGLDFCAAVKVNATTSHIPAILLTSRGYLAPLSELTDTSIIEVIAKPFSAKEVLVRVQEILAKSTPQQKSQQRSAA